MLFGAIFWSSLPNDNMKFSFSRFWEQCKLSAVTHSLPSNENHLDQASKSALQLFCTTRPTNLMQSYISMRCFGCSSCHSFFNSPIMYQAHWKLAQVSSPNTWSIYITYIDTSIICGQSTQPPVPSWPDILTGEALSRVWVTFWNFQTFLWLLLE